MSRLAPAPPLLAVPAPTESNSALLRELLWLSLPVMAEQVLHMLVGLNDTYLANHLPTEAASAGAAIGTIQYFLWFVGLMVASVGAGSTAIIARTRGAKHRSLANSVCGQSVAASVLLGLGVGALLYLAANPIIELTGLRGVAPALAVSYLRMLSVSLPFTMIMLIASACLRGAGDSLTPAKVMIGVDVVNMVCSFALTRGWWGLPVMGFHGIALGTIIAYVVGGVVQFAVLVRGRGGIRLYWHRLRPHWITIKRLLRIGLPAGMEGLISWFANFGVIRVINTLDATNAMSAAHITAIRVESVSFLSGFAFATGAATMVGQSLGMKDPRRAQRAAYLAYAVGGGIMITCGLLFITLGRYPAAWLAPPDPHIVHLTTQCLFITGFIQSGFAAAMVFGGALRGAGDTFVVMIASLLSVVFVRFLGVMIVGSWLHQGLAAIWCVLATELFLRGCLIFGRFQQGGWKRVRV